jgi:hypothetical protein
LPEDFTKLGCRNTEAEPLNAPIEVSKHFELVASFTPHQLVHAGHTVYDDVVAHHDCASRPSAEGVRFDQLVGCRPWLRPLAQRHEGR